MGTKRKRKKMRQPWNRYIWILTVMVIGIGFLPIQVYADEPEQIVFESSIFEDSEDRYYPDEILEQNGKQYQRISVELREAEKRGILTYVSTVISCQLEGKQMPPEQAEITLVFDITGEEYQREVPLQEIREKNTFWKEDFSFPITVYGYGADVFYLGEHEVPAGTDLAEYSSYFLEYLNLPQDCYRIDRVEWSGESYESEGVFCRDAIAYGEKIIRDVEAVYGGQVRTPNIPAKQYVAVYEEIIETETYDEVTEAQPEELPEMEETSMESEAIADPTTDASIVDKMVRWIKEHITVVVFSGVFLSCLVGAVWLLWAAGKKKAGD